MDGSPRSVRLVRKSAAGGSASGSPLSCSAASASEGHVPSPVHRKGLHESQATNRSDDADAPAPLPRSETLRQLLRSCAFDHADDLNGVVACAKQMDPGMLCAAVMAFLDNRQAAESELEGAGRVDLSTSGDLRESAGGSDTSAPLDDDALLVVVVLAMYLRADSACAAHCNELARTLLSTLTAFSVSCRWARHNVACCVGLLFRERFFVGDPCAVLHRVYSSLQADGGVVTADMCEAAAAVLARAGTDPAASPFAQPLLQALTTRRRAEGQRSSVTVSAPLRLPGSIGGSHDLTQNAALTRSQKEELTARTVYLNRIDPKATEGALREIFLKHGGAFTKVRLCGDAGAHRARYAFVEFQTAAAAAALVALDQRVVDGVLMQCLPAKAPIQDHDPAHDALFNAKRGCTRACLFGMTATAVAAATSTAPAPDVGTSSGGTSLSASDGSVSSAPHLS